jgi:quercetin dioxygenase-like cupin family protein
MKSISDYIGGWFIGNFEPTLHKTESFEVAVKHYYCGQVEKPHYHKFAVEFTVIIGGTAKINDIIYKDGDIVKIMPGEISVFEAITDLKTLVIKTPSVKNDKYIV